MMPWNPDLSYMFKQFFFALSKHMYLVLFFTQNHNLLAYILKFHTFMKNNALCRLKILFTVIYALRYFKVHF